MILAFCWSKFGAMPRVVVFEECFLGAKLDQDEMSIKVEISIGKLQYFALAHNSLEGELDRKMEMGDAF